MIARRAPRAFAGRGWRRGWLVAGLVLVAALPAQADLEIAVRCEVEEVELGEAFPLEVVRSWRRDLVPEPFEPRDLAPLRLRPLGRVRRTEGAWIRERLRYRAHVFARGAILVPGPQVRAWPVAGGEPRTARAPDLHLAVRSALQAGSEGDVELDLDLVEVPGRVRRWPWLAAAAFVILVLLAFARRRRERPLAAHRAALLGLGELEARAPAAREEAIELSRLLRGYLAARFGVEITGRTTDELVGELERRRILDEGARACCAAVLEHCDAVKFRGGAVRRADRDRVRAVARDFVLHTAEGEHRA